MDLRGRHRPELVGFPVEASAVLESPIMWHPLELQDHPPDSSAQPVPALEQPLPSANDRPVHAEQELGAPPDFGALGTSAMLPAPADQQLVSMEFEIPAGFDVHEAGGQLAWITPLGTTMVVAIPEGVTAGQRVAFSVPACMLSTPVPIQAAASELGTEQAAGEPPSPEALSKTMHACTACRKSKVACDDSLPCRRCTRLGLPCSSSREVRKRACQACNKAKVACAVSAGETCARCIRLGYICVPREDAPTRKRKKSDAAGPLALDNISSLVSASASSERSAEA